MSGYQYVVVVGLSDAPGDVVVVVAASAAALVVVLDVDAASGVVYSEVSEAVAWQVAKVFVECAAYSFVYHVWIQYWLYFEVVSAYDKYDWIAFPWL